MAGTTLIKSKLSPILGQTKNELIRTEYHVCGTTGKSTQREFSPEEITVKS